MRPGTAAILPAAGLSKRMGQQKLLLPLGDRPVIVRSIQTLLQAGIPAIIVVTGPEGSLVRDAIRDLPVIGVMNPHTGSDMAGSVRAGLGALGSRYEGVFVLPGDHPLIAPSTITAMGDTFCRDPGIVIPRYQGRKGHPVLFPRDRLAEIGEVPTMREIIRNHPEDLRFVETTDEGILIDMDTPEDYREVLRRFSGSAGVCPAQPVLPFPVDGLDRQGEV